MDGEASSGSLAMPDERMPRGAALRTWAFATGYLGLASSIALALFFALADPFGRNLRTWSWLGPANDVLSVALAPVQIIAAVLVWRYIVAGITVAVLTVLMSLGTANMAITTVRMLAGSATLDDQYIAAIPAIVLMFAWLLSVGVTALRGRRLPRALGRWAVAIGAAGVVALLAFGVGFILPAGSAAQWVAFISGGVPGALVYLAYPVWWLVLGSRPL